MDKVKVLHEWICGDVDGFIAAARELPETDKTHVCLIGAMNASRFSCTDDAVVPLLLAAFDTTPDHLREITKYGFYDLSTYDRRIAMAILAVTSEDDDESTEAGQWIVRAAGIDLEPNAIREATARFIAWLRQKRLS